MTWGGAGRHALGRRLLALACLILPASIGASQPNLPRDLYEERLRQQGDQLAFCVNAASMMAGFESSVAEHLAASLLLRAKVIAIDPIRPTAPLDYRLPLSTDELFPLMAEQCDAFMGFTLASSGYPPWLVITRPYLSAGTVLAVTVSRYRRLEDIPTDRPIGARSLSAADNQLLNYLRSLPEAARWRRFPYPNNRLLLDRLIDGTIAAALVWRPALERAAGAMASVATIEELPFQIAPVEIGIALRAKDAFLRSSLDQAIDALAEDGTLERLMIEHGLAAPGGKQSGR